MYYEIRGTDKCSLPSKTILVTEVKSGLKRSESHSEAISHDFPQNVLQINGAPTRICHGTKVVKISKIYEIGTFCPRNI
jgi:hypothetical protein